MNAPPTELAPLGCTNCGAALCLGVGATTRCSYCAAEAAIPDTYLGLQRSAREFAKNRELAADLYGEVGQPPGPLLRMWWTGADKTAQAGKGVLTAILGLMLQTPLGFLLLPSAAYLLGYPVAAVLRVSGLIAPEQFEKDSTTYIVLLATAGVMIVLAAIPAVLLRRERELAPVRGAIHASLAATPPQHAGGPARCRQCGAGLDVPPGALGVPCVYCRADNLVALPEPWVAHLRRSEFTQFRSIASALEAFREANTRARERYWLIAVGLILSLPVVSLIGWVLNQAGFHF
ncbi:MAG: hypothetical protein R3B13_03095 [Polyangiaceae bacterium]